MSLVLSHGTALKLYRSSLMPLSMPARIPLAQVSLPKPRVVIRLRALSPLVGKETVHCVVSSANCRRDIGAGLCHVCGGDVEVLFLQHLEGDSELCVVSPETLFLQMASELSLIELVRLGYELCGAYSLSLIPIDGSGQARFNRRMPLTYVDRIRRYLEGASHARSVKKARMALRFVVDGSASPKETQLCMLLVLPRRMGGYGLERPSFNHRVKAFDSLGYSAKAARIGCGLLWRNAKVAVEYDGSSSECDGFPLGQVIRCGNASALDGFDVVSVSDWHVGHPEALDKVAGMVARRHGRGLRRDMRYDFSARQSMLREQVLL